MHLFLWALFGIYGSAHVYIFLKIKAAFPFGWGTDIGLSVFLGAMTCAPILVHLLERGGYEIPARMCAYIGYSWMGMLFLFLCLAILLDAYRIIIEGLQLLFSLELRTWLPEARIAFLMPGLLAVALYAYGYAEALRIRPEHITIHTDKLPATIERLRIVQISDVHLGLIVRAGRARRILEAIRASDPDIVVSTGDLVDGQANSLAGLAEAFREIQPRYGKYAVTGNHEFYAGLSHALDFNARAGFTTLRGEAITLDGLVTIAAIDDPAGKAFGLYRGVQEGDLLGHLPRHTYTVLLKHLPLVRNESLGQFDLQLSGHTHKGQIFPFNLVTRAFFSYNTGWFNLGGGSRVAVSRGTGTWGPPVRLCAPPQLTIIDLMPDGA